MTKLVIVESPAKCQKIQGFLGQGWRVIASMGHIRALEENLDAIGIDRDFEAKYEFIKEKAKVIKQLKEESKDATDIYLAADHDREGENIAYSVCLLLKLNPKTAKRVVFHEITKKAIINAVNSPCTLDMNRINAQQSRAILDMMIGFTMSPLLWRYVSPSLSAGRCQTPALRLVVEREDLIQNFKTSLSWQLSANWSTSQEVVKERFKFNAKMEDELDDEESAINYMEIVHTTPDGSIISKDIRPWSQSAPEPLITSTLQQQVSALFSINPKNCMKIAQRLYESGHITYMRTDKAVLSEEATIEARQWVEENYGKEFVMDVLENSPQKEEKKSKKKPKVAETKQEGDEVKAQEAHEAIRPTHMNITELPEGDWSPYDKKVYNLIWQRAIQSVMALAQGETCKVRVQIDDDEDFKWSSQWKHTTFEGWKRAGKVAQIDDTSDEDSDEDTDTNGASKKDIWDKASKLQVGDKVKWMDMKAEPKETKAQGRYTEATLVRELEKFGIGRPSTFASLIATIQDKNYVETKNIPAKEVSVKEYSLKPLQWPADSKEFKKKAGAEKNKLVPTDLGRSVLTFMLKHFNDLFEYGFTSQMEKRLDKIAEGLEPWKEVLRDTWASYKDRYNDLSSKQQIKAKSGEANAKVKEFSKTIKGLKAVQSKKGPLLLIEGVKKEDTQFIGWPSGVAFEDMTEECALKFKEEEEKKKCGNDAGEWNGQKILKKSGKFGEYLQCGEVSIPYQEGEELEKTIERFVIKQSGTLKQCKDYVIRTGQYGPYIIKTSLKKPQFVSIPKGVDIVNLTEKDIETLYKTGLESKKKWNADKSNKKNST
jgi:DNA topoisomerase-1